MPSPPPPPEPIDPPAAGLDLQDPEVVIDLLTRAARANLDAPARRGAVWELPAEGRLLATGDLHDHGLNLQRILKLATLHEDPGHHLVLHEVIHGPAQINGRDLSIRTLARVCALKLDYPDQVILMQANHELAQLGGEGILKDGASVVEAFDQGVAFLYGDRADAVLEALHGLIRSLLLAVRCANGVMCCHSLPGPRQLERFDPTVLGRVPTAEDLSVGGSGYLMVWGRKHTQALADELAAAWGVKVFVMGHQPAEMGYELEGDTMIVLASDHSHGVALPIDLAQPADRDELAGRIVPLASVTL